MIHQDLAWGLVLFAAAAVAASTDTSASPGGCASLSLHGQRARAEVCYRALTQSADPYLRAEGDWGLELYQDANVAFRTAVARADGNALYRMRWGRLLHERFNDADAAQLFAEALQRDPKNAQAYLGLALVSAQGFDDKAQEYLDKALQLDPDLVEAHVLLANLELEDADVAQATAAADLALRLDPEALDAMAVEAAVALLSDQSPERWLQRILAINPSYGRAYADVAHHLVLTRRYEEGVAYYRQAIGLDPRLWSARSELGINLMRIGQQQEAQAQLQRCYEAGYRDAATVNSLRLLDTYSKFVSVEDEASVLRFDPSESALLQRYFRPLLQSALATYERKYQMQLPGRVQVEVYPNHEDFAVRTVGLPGLGALGVTFGTVVAMDSPSGRKPGSFNWATTLWHEMDHVFVLTATHNRVPRWFAEGLAVHEQGQARREWAYHLTPDVVSALAQKKLLPVAQLDRGFIRPEYPEQILVSYYQAGRVCDYIQQRWGADALVRMVHLYAQPVATPEVIRQVTGLDPAQFDLQFQAWLYQDVGAVVTNFDAWRAQLKHLVQLYQAHQYDEALAEGEAVRRLYPQYVEDANAYSMLADIDSDRGDKAAAIAVLLDYQQHGGEDPAMLRQLATLQQQAGQPQNAAATLDAINDIYPVHDESLHAQLGQLWLTQGNTGGAIREFGAVVALHPADQAGALFHLAQAYFAAHQPQAAEQNVLAALEAAPGYRPAQQLLLQIEDEPPPRPQ
jgi:tetratricopeptide (TPR) repeat protein